LGRAASPWTSTFVGALFFCSYLLLSPPVSGDKDASEFTLVLATFGVAHPTGYPLFTIMGHGFVRIAHALGASWPRAANAWSALGGGVAMALFHALSVRICVLASGGAPILWWIAPALLFGLDPMWTQETTLAEVYSWHVAWVLGACLLFVAAAREIMAPGERDRRLRFHAALWGAWCGAGVAHHLTSVFVAAPLSGGLAIAMGHARRRRPHVAAVALAASLIPLASYVWIAWHAFHPARFQWPMLAPAWRSVLQHVTGAQYGSLLGHFAPSRVQQAYLASYVYPYAALGLAALAVAAWRARPGLERFGLRSLLLAALLPTGYAFLYGAYDPSSYFLGGMAIGLAGAGALCARLFAAWPRGRAGRAALAALVALALGAQLAPWVRTSLERTRVLARFDGLVHRMWAAIPFERGFVGWGEDMYPKLIEYQILAAEKPGLTVVNPFVLTYSVPRDRFVAEHGFDPLGGIESDLAPAISGVRAFAPGREAETREAGDLILENINRQTPLPVVEFLPESVSVRLLRKPAAAAH